MTAAVVALSIVVAILTFLVAGLLRSHAEILRKLHELGAGLEDIPSPVDVSRKRQDVPVGAHIDGGGRPAHDLAGVTPTGDPLVVRVTEVEHDTVLVFLSTGCATCADFWAALGDDERIDLPDRTRLVIVTQGAEHESPARIADLAPPARTLAMSSEAWADYGIPGSPYVIHVDGPSGRIRGEGTHGTWEQVARMLAEATGDLAFLGRPQARKHAADNRREQDTDAALLAAGIELGDPRLYGDPPQ